MTKNSNKAMLCAAMAVGLGAVGAVGAMSMQRSGGMSSRQGRRMLGMVSNISEEFADEFCMMAHKTGNAMIKTGRWINRLIP